MKNPFTWFLGFAVVALAVIVLLMTRTNAALRVAIQERDEMIASRAAEVGLGTGDTVDPLELFSPAGEPGTLAFGPEPALVLLVSTGCDACDLAVPAWESLIAEGLPGVTVVCLDMTAREPSELTPKSAVFDVVGVGDPAWLHEIPVTPSVLVIGPDARVAGAWYGLRAARRTAEMRAVLDDILNGG